MADKRIFKIGQVVVVNKMNRIIHVYKNLERVRKLVRFREANKYGNNPIIPEFVNGVITGVRKMHEGTVLETSDTPIHFHPNFHPDYYLDISKVQTLWAVRTGYINKEMYFFQEDIIRGETIVKEGANIPWFDASWSVEAKEFVSRKSKDWPRDEKGRFI